MKIVTLGIDYSDICKDYNTMYLDRDNTDIATKQCMKKVMDWFNKFLSELLQEFQYKIYYLNSPKPVEVELLASKRFLFYSLEKEITLQDFVIQKEYTKYENSTQWIEEKNNNLLIKNDEEGEGLHLYVKENSDIYNWIKTKLKSFSLEEVALD